MIKLCHIVLINFSCIPFTALCQYYGGDADGFTFNTLTQTVCPPLASANIFYGGDADGFTFNTLTQTVCPPLANANIFYGGDADGFTFNTLTQTVCPPLASNNIFYGGDADGFTFNILTQTVCPPLANTNIFYGGDADGLTFNTLTQTFCPPLPVELLSFNAECDKRKVILRWITASEQNAAYFTIERSVDAVNYLPVGTAAATGNSSMLLHYSFTDSDPMPFSYYRLTETDFNGETEIFSPNAVSCNEEMIAVYPIIGTGLFFIYAGQNANITVNDVVGGKIHSAAINPGIQPVDLTSKPSGIYFMTIQTEKESFSQKIVVQK